MGGLLATATVLLIIVGFADSWSGKKAWEDCRRQLERRGEVLDWQAYIPPPIPDDENIYAAPHIAGMLIRDGHDAYVEDLQQSYVNAMKAATRHDTNEFCVVQLVVTLPGKASPPDITTEYSLTDTNLPKNIGHLIETTVGPRCNSVRGFGLLTRDPALIQPAKIALHCDHLPTIADLKRIFPESDWPLKEDQVRIRPVPETRNYELVLDFGSFGWCQPKNYLRASAENEPVFELIASALSRPQARLPGDYNDPSKIPAPGFVRLRDLAQELTIQAQCELLMGEPDQALKQLTLLYELQRFTLGCPPRPLVTSMIGAVIFGLYCETIGDGLRLQAWHESELVQLQRQLQEINLLPLLPAALRFDRAALCRILENTATASVKTGYRLHFHPRNWMIRNFYYANLANLAWLQQTNIDSLEAAPGQIVPQLLETTYRQQMRLLTGWRKYSPFTFFAAISVIDPRRAARTLADKQTQLNQAQVALALERYRLAEGKYPDTLGQLVPQFITKLPSDIIGGQALKYHRTAADQFVLYSIGWNEKDDGGQVQQPKGDSPESFSENGDWVWPQ